jgi:hypothetical protein
MSLIFVLIPVINDHNLHKIRILIETRIDTYHFIHLLEFVAMIDTLHEKHINIREYLITSYYMISMKW